MKGAAKEDRSVWEEFESNLATLGPQSEALLHDLLTNKADQEVDLLDYERIKLEPSIGDAFPAGPTETTATVKVRRGAAVFPTIHSQRLWSTLLY